MEKLNNVNLHLQLGSAGGGKTTRLKGRVTDIEEQEGFAHHIHFVSYTKKVIYDVRQRFSSIMRADQITTLHSLMLQIILQSGARIEGSVEEGKKEYSQDIEWKFLQLTTEEIVNAMPDLQHLIVDEVQDLNTRQVECLLYLCSGYEKFHLYLAGDIKQAIYSTNKVDVYKDFSHITKYFDPEKIEVEILDKNWRFKNRKLQEITNWLTATLYPASNEQQEYRERYEYDDPIRLIAYKNIDREINGILQIAKMNKSKDILVVCRHKNQVTRIENGLVAADIRTGGAYKVEHIDVGTIHSAKGLEADIVIYSGFEDKVITGKQVEKNLLYIACTRAKEKMYITTAHHKAELSFFENAPGIKLIDKQRHSCESHWKLPILRTERLRFTMAKVSASMFDSIGVRVAREDAPFFKIQYGWDNQKKSPQHWGFSKKMQNKDRFRYEVAYHRNHG